MTIKPIAPPIAPNARQRLSDRWPMAVLCRVQGSARGRALAHVRGSEGAPGNAGTGGIRYV